MSVLGFYESVRHSRLRFFFIAVRVSLHFSFVSINDLGARDAARRIRSVLGCFLRGSALDGISSLLLPKSELLIIEEMGFGGDVQL